MFSNAIDISEDGSQSWHPIIKTFDGLNVYFIWEDIFYGNPNIFFTKSQDSGISFSKNIAINQNGRIMESPNKLFAILMGLVAVPFLYLYYLKRQKKKKILPYLSEIETICETNRNQNDQCIQQLKLIKEKMKQLFVKGILTEQQYNLLNKKIDNHILVFNCQMMIKQD